ncbi:MAG: glycosyltransferase family 4 protein [Candidatus Limisoma sp.]
MQVVCFHLYNDYSGSPRVLRTVVDGLLREGVDVTLVSSRGGALDGIVSHSSARFRHIAYNYKFSTNPAVTMLRYSFVQLLTFFIALRWTFRRDVTFYVNTILPVAPALAGRLTGKRVVYHYHENASVKSAMYRFLSALMQRLAHEIVCVSDYQASLLARRRGITVVPNAVPDAFRRAVCPNAERAFDEHNVLMLSSLKDYKGTREFFEIAQRLPDRRFTLVVNDEMSAIEKYIAERGIVVPSNLTVFPRQTDIVDFYRRASVVVNLSNPRMFIETFGMTVAEAMTAGLPVIVPTVGGVADLVDEGVNGYKIDVSELNRITNKIDEILSNRELYCRLSHEAQRRSEQFSEQRMVESIKRIVFA